ncbi:MAG: NADH-quinone oxidoreductase subunit K [Anaerolineae bacterium]|nr:NADH-quinone oxidoreductase subunit K [Anaerolineae bacterium]MCO5194221.1 NADH-quinone oxidoreductase subunit K [Anaerolineae bacterium]MCO5198924.1 NADH-quinone oxidoreductase subunit K [Anaerolineae bacterium]MCO5206006.1 NADH-quinone oxidoreductase subunit K [Anaerolineae bacterium]
MILIIAIGIGTLFAIALYQMLQRNVIRSAIGVILLGSAINLFLLTAGNSNGTGPAYSTVTETQVDPLPQALVLTAIVISMGGLAFILAMLYIISARYQTGNLDEIDNLKH